VAQRLLPTPFTTLRATDDIIRWKPLAAQRSHSMVNTQTLQGNWNEMKGKIKSKWGQLTGDDLQSFNGNVDQLVGLIQRKTGEGRAAVEHFLEELTSNGSSSISQAAESVREYATQVAGETSKYATQMANETTKRAGEAAESVRHGVQEAEKMIRQRPAESAAVCFGTGVLVGVLLGLVLRR
jgi:uncharacterized protein YjbJ (UPF0337 family)